MYHYVYGTLIILNLTSIVLGRIIVRKLQMLLYVGSIIVAVGIGMIQSTHTIDNSLGSVDCSYLWATPSDCTSVSEQICNRSYTWGSGSGENYLDIYFPQCVDRSQALDHNDPNNYLSDPNCYAVSNKAVSDGCDE
jgi:hypothetical protein